MKYTDAEQKLLISAIDGKIDALEAQLEELYILRDKTIANVIDENNVIKEPISAPKAKKKRSSLSRNKLFEKIRLALLTPDENGDVLNDRFFTTREILNLFYQAYPGDLDEKEDRKNIAVISSILSLKVLENELIQEKKDKEQTKFKLKKDLSYEADMHEKQTRVETSVALPF